MNEIKRQLKLKIGDTTKHQQQVVRKIHERDSNYVKKNKTFFSAVVSVALLVATCLFVFSLKEESSHTTALDVVPTPVVEEIETPVEVPPQIVEEIENSAEVQTPLTEEQKQQYYAQYVEIVDNVMDKKLGMGIGVVPIDEFEESDWVEPQEFERRIQAGVKSFLKRERERLAAMSSNLEPAVMNPDGTTTKAQYLYFSDIVKKIEVTATFDTRYDAVKNRRVFSEVNNISAEMLDAYATWESTFVEATLLDGGRTYSVYMEGIFYYNGMDFEKAFTIEFYCDEFGEIS